MNEQQTMFEWRITYQANKDEPVEVAVLDAYDEDHLRSEAMDEFGSPLPRDLVVVKIEKLGEA